MVFVTLASAGCSVTFTRACDQAGCSSGSPEKSTRGGFVCRRFLVAPPPPPPPRARAPESTSCLHAGVEVWELDASGMPTPLRREPAVQSRASAPAGHSLAALLGSVASGAAAAAAAAGAAAAAVFAGAPAAGLYCGALCFSPHQTLCECMKHAPC